MTRIYDILKCNVILLQFYYLISFVYMKLKVIFNLASLTKLRQMQAAITKTGFGNKSPIV